MTEEEKQLLLKDLCARLPYGVMYETSYGPRVLNDIFIYFNGPVYTDHGIGNYNEVYGIELENIRPYLRPMSSMTDKEETLFRCELPAIAKTDAQLVAMRMELFLKGHLDFNHLIEKGLALEAPEDMYKIE